MALESLISPLEGEEHPWLVFWMGIAFSTLAIMLAVWLFPKYASLFFVFFLVMSVTPLFYMTLGFEENKDMKTEDEGRLIKEHYKALRFLMYMFYGVTIAVAIAYIVIPSSWTTAIFGVQQETISSINGQMTGSAVQAFNSFLSIFFNNFRVVLFILLFSFVFGVGSIFILIWNASVIGVAMGNYFRTKLAMFAASVGMTGAATYLKVSGLSILRYAIHGIPEVAAYFTAGLAGGILSVAIIQRHILTKQGQTILYDSSDLIVLSILFLFVAALLEVYVTPVFY